jgi:hypothetical protein
MIDRRTFLALPLLMLSARSRSAGRPMIVGSYDAARMKAMKSLTFPRVLLYDAARRLVHRDAWPAELEVLQQAAGDAFCCVSDTPSPPGHRGPPPGCKVVVHGEHLHDHFVGLRRADGTAIDYAALPAHAYLVVEYFASWCAPCIPARRALEAFLATPAAERYVALVVDFSSLENDDAAT